jgi:hypothetical protein
VAGSKAKARRKIAAPPLDLIDGRAEAGLRKGDTHKGLYLVYVLQFVELGALAAWHVQPEQQHGI